MNTMKSEKRIARYKRRAISKGKPYGRHLLVYKDEHVTVTRHATKGRIYRDVSSTTAQMYRGD